MTDNIRQKIIKESARHVRRDMCGTACGIKTTAHTYIHTYIHIHAYVGTESGPQTTAVTGTHLEGFPEEPARAIRGFRGVSSECADVFGAMRSSGLQVDQVRDGKYLWWFGVQSDPPRGRGE